MFKLFAASKRAEFATLVEELEAIDERAEGGVFLSAAEGLARRAEIESRLVHLVSKPVDGDERRRAVRIVCEVGVRVRKAHGEGAGVVVDIGSGGAFIETDVAAETGETVELEFDPAMPHAEPGLAVRAVVCWLNGDARRQAAGFGVAFVADHEAAARATRKFVLAIMRSELVT